MGIITNLIAGFLEKATISYKTQLNPTTYHIQLHGEALKKANYLPGYFVRVFVGRGKDLAFKDNLRSYSAWKLNKLNGTLELAVCTHAGGPGSTWAKECRVGDEVSFTWKKCNLVVDNSADNYLFVGDSAALGHLYEVHRNLGKGKVIKSLIYDDRKENLFADLNGSKPFDFLEISSTNAVPTLLNLLPDTLKDISSNTIVYIGGDSRVCLALSTHLRKELKWDARRIKTKPFWNPTKTGLE
ncbi:MAG: siderophore-interacting protein [Pedobacter sp.]